MDSENVKKPKSGSGPSADFESEIDALFKKMCKFVTGAIEYGNAELEDDLKSTAARHGASASDLAEVMLKIAETPANLPVIKASYIQLFTIVYIRLRVI